MLNYRSCLLALRSACQNCPLTSYPGTCGLGSTNALWTSGHTLRLAGGRVSYSQYRHMSLLYYMRKIPKRFKEFQRFQLNIVERPTKSSKFPSEIATYLWLISLKARVRFTNGKWYTSEVKGIREERPVKELMKYNIDAIDAKDTLIDYHGMAQIIKLQQLKLLSFEGCPYIDDSCLSRLVHLKDSLTHLNINKCPQITERGLACLHHLSNLERLNMNDLSQVPHAKVMACMLEDTLPKLRIGLVTEEYERHKRLRDRWRPPPDQASSKEKEEGTVEKAS
ncbi:ATP synthase subunit s-like protein [Acanthaster planci]|uniref:ATP synthase subunit s-like protein n=1 Tax=Acanthaster planci TaxID=133434 RepID=A0A8B7YG05_ACAPL|nr:ATP synthase subunit s-like protein [Acanthaster planci]